MSVCLFVIIFAVCRRGGLGLSHVMDDEGRCGKMIRGGGSRGAMSPPPLQFCRYEKGRGAEKRNRRRKRQHTLPVEVFRWPKKGLLLI